MSTFTTASTVGEIAALVPEAADIFEDFGIDYCCAGKKSLEEACASSRISALDVLQSIQSAERTVERDTQKYDWRHESLASLIAHIRNTHHKYTREEITRITPILRKVVSVHGTAHPELRRIEGVFTELSSDLLDHMIDEEIALFPYIARLEESVTVAAQCGETSFDTLREPVATMVFEHDAAGGKIKAIRQASRGFSIPGDVCMSYRVLYKSLADFEADLHKHIHLENNILFPRAIELETARCR